MNVNRRIHYGARNVVLIVATLFTILLTQLAFAQNDNSAALQKILKTMDATAATFHTAQADFQWDTYTAVVSDHDLKTGTVYYRKQGSNVEMAAEVRGAQGGPVQQQVLYKNGKVHIYNYGTKQSQDYAAGKNKEDVQSFLVLGFGGSGRDLQRLFDVRYAGTESVQGVDAVKLELTPKAAGVKNMFNRIVLWINPSNGISVQQQAFAPAGDYKLSKYSNIKINEKLPDDVFKSKP